MNSSQNHSEWLEITRNPSHSKQNLLGMRLESARTGIQADPSGMVRIWSEYSELKSNLAGCSQKFHSYQILTIPLRYISRAS